MLRERSLSKQVAQSQEWSNSFRVTAAFTRSRLLVVQVYSQTQKGKGIGTKLVCCLLSTNKQHTLSQGHRDQARVLFIEYQ
jgi:hypothetical protein